MTTATATSSTDTIFGDLSDIVERNYPLARHTWYRIGGPARYFVRPRNVEELQTVARRCAEHGVPVYVLGLGANLLVSDAGVPGVVVKLDADHWRRVKIDRETNGDDGPTLVTANSGVDLQKLVLRTCREGLAGFECMAGIPGTIGGGVRMNAGGKYGDIGGRVRSVTVMTADGKIFDRTRDDLVFEYRKVNIAAPYILSATLELDADDPDACTKRTKEIWMYKNSTQPLNTKSAGCMFKNPRGLSAGSLIDRSGLKGHRVGGAEVSDKHANFIVAHPGCTSRDVLDLVAEVRQKVEAKQGVVLESEVKVWP